MDPCTLAMLLLQIYDKCLWSPRTTGTIMKKEILGVTGQKRGFAALFDMDSNGVSEVNRSF